MVTEIEPQDVVQTRKLASKSPALDKIQPPEIELEGSSEPEIHEYPTGLKLWLIILTMAALLILGGLDTNIVATAVPRYVIEYQITSACIVRLINIA